MEGSEFERSNRERYNEIYGPTDVRRRPVPVQADSDHLENNPQDITDDEDVYSTDYRYAYEDRQSPYGNFYDFHGEHLDENFPTKTLSERLHDCLTRNRNQNQKTSHQDSCSENGSDNESDNETSEEQMIKECTMELELPIFSPDDDFFRKLEIDSKERISLIETPCICEMQETDVTSRASICGCHAEVVDKALQSPCMLDDTLADPETMDQSSLNTVDDSKCQDESNDKMDIYTTDNMQIRHSIISVRDGTGNYVQSKLRRRWILFRGVMAVCFIAAVAVGTWSYFFFGPESKTQNTHGVRNAHGRQLLASSNNETCTDTSVIYFPSNLHSAIKEPALSFLLALVLIYSFIALAEVIDNYFVPALEHCTEDLGIQAHVAGATIMAACSSAPKLGIVVIALATGQSNSYVYAIVGSCIFNMLLVAAAVGLFAGHPTQLTWYPVVRETVFFTIAIIELGVMSADFNGEKDSEIYWYESLVLVLTYLAYIVFMFFNKHVEKFAYSKVPKKIPAGRRTTLEDEYRMKTIQKRRRSSINSVEVVDVNMLRSSMKELMGMGFTQDEAHEFLKKARSVKHWSKDVTRYTTPGPHGLTEKASNVITPADTEVGKVEDQEIKSPIPDNKNISEKSTSADSAHEHEGKPKVTIDFGEVVEEEETVADPFIIDVHPFTIPPTMPGKLWWSVTLPITCLHFITIPDSRYPPGSCQHRAYLLSLLISLLYICGYSYIMVWIGTLICYQVDIKDDVTVGLITLGVVISLPGLFSSVYVARDGYGEMAISNAIGSNICGILLCLGLPWLLNDFITEKASPILSEALLFFSILMLVALIMLFGALKWTTWKLDSKSGCASLILYFVTITGCILLGIFAVDEVKYCLVAILDF